MNETVYKIPCQKCNGEGYLQNFLHVEGGICFKCEGSKFEEVTQEQYNDYYEWMRDKKAESQRNQRQQFDEAYKHFFNNFNRSYVQDKSKNNIQSEDGISSKKFEIKGNKESGFYIEIENKQIAVKAIFQRRPNNQQIYLATWRVI